MERIGMSKADWRRILFDQKYLDTYLADFTQERTSQEVDFVVKKRNKIEQLIQVCYNLSDQKTKKRELGALVKASDELRCKKLQVITYDKEGTEKFANKKIMYIPLWKWLLQ